MLRPLAWLFFTLLLTAPALSKTKIEKSTFNFEGKVRTYYSFIPDQDGPLPLVVLLHGSQRNGLVMADAWKGLAAKEHFIIAAPDSYDPSRWDSDVDGPSFLRAMISQVKASHAVDPDRMYLFGHSGGAVYALGLALLESEVYAAVAVHAGVLPQENTNLLPRAQRKIPIAIWVGDRDQFFPTELVKQCKTEFESSGFRVELTVMPNKSHSYEDVSDSINHDAWVFFQKAGPQDRR